MMLDDNVPHNSLAGTSNVSSKGPDQAWEDQISEALHDECHSAALGVETSLNTNTRRRQHVNAGSVQQTQEHDGHSKGSGSEFGSVESVPDAQDDESR
jgi:hypothetical protein